MKIPPDAVISVDKLTRYLLVKREFDDKSIFLSGAGFTLENYLDLMHEFKCLIGREDAVQAGEGPYGIFWSVTGALTGPHGKQIRVVTIWLQQKRDGIFRFITMKPYKG